MKRLLIACVIAASALAAVGASSASATVLCENNTTPCNSPKAAGSTYAANLSTGNISKFAAGFATIECSTSAIGIKQTGAGGSGVRVGGTITSLSFGNCNSGKATVTVKSLGKLEIEYSSGMSGTVETTGTELEVVLGATQCFYRADISSGLTLVGGAPATLTAVNAPLTRQTGSTTTCAVSAKWNAEYSLTSNLWVAAS